MKKVIILFTVLFSVCHAKAQEAVDLGLSVKWANMNVGASSPNDKGGLYAWGETVTKQQYTYSWENYFDTKHYEVLPNGGGWKILFTTFNSVKIPMSGSKYDVARVKWGGKWRMPTVAEFRELIRNCKIRYGYVGDKKIFTVTGPNGNSIVFPAVDRGDEAGGFTTNGNGNYWTATLDEESALDYKSTQEELWCAFSIYFHENGCVEESRERRMGYAVRPVMSYDEGENNTYKEQLKAKIKKMVERTDEEDYIDIYNMGMKYYNGKGVTKDRELASYIWGLLAAKGHESSKKMLSKMSVKGGEVKKKNTLEDYAEQAVKGDKTAQEYILKHQNEVQQSQEVLKKIAMAYVPSKCDFSKGWDNYCCYTAALMGNDKACVELADNGMKDSDLDTAIGLYEFAAKANNLDAMHRLGKIYLDQTLGRRDLEKGIYWYTKAADGGHSQAKRELGTFYKYGLNVKKNQKLAKLYLGSDYDD